MPHARGRTVYGLPCGYPWVATQDASDRLLLPNHSTTSTRVSSIPAMITGLSPDASRGIVRFTTQRSASAGPSCSGGERSLFVHRPTGRTSGTSVASPADARVAFARTSHSGAAKTAFTAAREDDDFHGPRYLLPSGDFALVPGPVSVAGTLGAFVARLDGFAATSRLSLPLRARLPPLVREAFPAR